MIEKPFINSELSTAIESYLKYKDKPEEPAFSSFLVMVIRTLIFIYGKLDIINPYITHNEHNMGGFDGNMTKYGFSKKKLEDFKQCFITYVKEREMKKIPNLSFLKIEKYLIDMYFDKQKMMNLPKEEQETFKKYLYLKENQDSSIQKELENLVLDKDELSFYFKSIAFEKEHDFVLEEIRRSTLIPEAYLLTGYNMDQISSLSDSDLRNVNLKIYEFFHVDANSKEKDDMLLKAVNYYKKYGNRVTSGNGYVDFLLFASILATAIFVSVLVIFY